MSHSYLAIVWRALGIESSALKLFSGWPYAIDYPGFRTHLVCGIGGNPSDWADYSFFLFNNHQVAVNPSFAAFDAATAHYYDTSGAVYQQNPVNWAHAAYWQTDAPGTYWYLFEYSYYVGLAKCYALLPYPVFGEPVALVTGIVNLTGYVDMVP